MPRKSCLRGFFALCIVVSACTRSNNLFLGRVEAKVGSHTVVVTDCYRTSIAPPQKTSGAEPNYRFTPCRDADILIRRGELLVNGRSYGPLKPADAVLVDHGVVSIGQAE